MVDSSFRVVVSFYSKIILKLYEKLSQQLSHSLSHVCPQKFLLLL